MYGTVFDIKEFAIFDGPGVRLTVFLKGCPLRCAWCHNPEGQKPEPELMVSVPSCVKCFKCESVCPKESDFDRAFMRSSACDGCGECIGVCPTAIRRISGKRYTPGELAELIKKSADYYASSGGGVTFSGGEPLMQSGFLCEVLDILGKDIHKAVETSGFCSPDIFRKVISRLDFVLMDIKVIDDVIHKKYIGASNAVILENYKTLRDSGLPHIIRIPLIPRVNCDGKNLEATARLLQGDSSLERVELLPYHKTAGAKYSACGRVYTPLPGANGIINVNTGIFEKYGIKAIIE